MTVPRAPTPETTGRFAPATRSLTTEEFADLFEAQALGWVDDVGRHERLLGLHAAGLLDLAVTTRPSSYTLSEAGLAALEGH